MNNIVISGNLTRDVELRTTGTGKSVASCSVACRKRFKPQDGPDSDFFDVSAWGQVAEYLSSYGTKGRKIEVQGRLETRDWTDKDGNKRKAYEIVADQASFLDKQAETQATSNAGEATAAKQALAPEDPLYDPFAE